MCGFYSFAFAFAFAIDDRGPGLTGGGTAGTLLIVVSMISVLRCEIDAR